VLPAPQPTCMYNNQSRSKHSTARYGAQAHQRQQLRANKCSTHVMPRQPSCICSSRWSPSAAQHSTAQEPREATHVPTHLQHGQAALQQLRPLLVKVVPVLEELVSVAPVKQVPVAPRVLLKLDCRFFWGGGGQGPVTHMCRHDPVGLLNAGAEVAAVAAAVARPNTSVSPSAWCGVLLRPWVSTLLVAAVAMLLLE
jgi:hypothetical protein